MPTWLFKRKIRRKKIMYTRHLSMWFFFFNIFTYLLQPYSAKLLNQPEYPSVGKWMKKMSPIYTMEFRSCTKKNEIYVVCKKMFGMENHGVNWNETNSNKKHHVFFSCVEFRMLRAWKRKRIIRVVQGRGVGGKRRGDEYTPTHHRCDSWPDLNTSSPGTYEGLLFCVQ